MECVTDARLAVVSRTESGTAPQLLNLGCGQRFHPAWTNLDLHPVHSSIQRWDVQTALPFGDETFDAVYHSHLFEHLPRARTAPFLTECHRVLKPGGVLRLAVPDLETIARLYLAALESAACGDAGALEEHRWLVMELYDQSTREVSGGEMRDYLNRAPCALARQRIGDAAGALAKGERLNADSRAVWRERLRGWLFGSWRERLIRWLLGPEYPLLQIGRFRRGGEVHQWMYDRVSLQAVLAEAGFADFRCVEPMESAIAGWIDYHLDVAPDGAIRKPDSLFVEARRPARNVSDRRIPS
ncbi:MAG: methyltransferase domain-containing protein [Planctomycetes bacterium]|nr:methyltransferase domain-containing protein [Planctomycetota bacterium]